MRKKTLSTIFFCNGKTLSFFAIAFFFALCLPAKSAAQSTQKNIFSKLSPMLRTLVRAESKANAPSISVSSATQKPQTVCAFVQTKDNNSTTLIDNGCKILADFGDLFIVEIPLSCISRLASDTHISRIEAERGAELTLDSMSLFTNATPIYEGMALPQAFTGSGVVMGIEDIGFDLTHPTFYNADGSTYRIKRFWDQLSTDTVGSTMPVGAEYTSQQEILNYGHSRDGLKQYHGTHTLGIAAGSGAGTGYRGMAPESDICLVSNAVSSDIEFIDSADLYKYTYAMDALGFKYIFDYADSQGKPCVISFSEGSKQDLRGDDMLYYEFLRRITGEGHIMVSSAGNEGLMVNYVSKPYGQSDAGTCLISSGSHVSVTTRSQGALSFRVTLYDTQECVGATPRAMQKDGNTILQFSTDDIVAMEDSCFTDTLLIDGTKYVIDAMAYPSCYDNDLLAMDITLSGPKQIGFATRISMELVGAESSGEMFSMYGEMRNGDESGLPDDAVCTHNINSPSSSPSVICVGATCCRPTFKNVLGDTITTNYGPTSHRGNFSSVGPTFDGRIKPDVMAPGANIISAVGNAYMSNNADKANKYLVAKQTFQGKEYGWLATGGTSMSSPAVGGIIALWLQANPRLTPDDVLGIIARTSTPCEGYGETPNNHCGYGVIDAYAGLLEALNLSGIEAISKRNPQGIGISFHRGNRLDISFDDVAKYDFKIKVYDTSGALLLTRQFPGGAMRYEIDLNSLPSGIYAVQTDSRDKAATGSVLIRKE